MASFSSLSRLTGCKRKAVFGTVMSRFRGKSDALTFGTAFHSSLEKGLDSGIAELRREHMHDSIPLLTEMWKRQTVFMADQGIEILEHELPFEITLPGLTEPFRGFIDGLAMWRDEVWLLEFKTARYIDASHVAIDSQVTSYLWACRETGLCEPKGVLYFINQKSMDKPPVVLASGHLSTAKNQGCSYDAYVQKAIEIYGDTPPAKVELFMEWLEQNEQPKLVMAAVKRTESQLDSFGEMVKEYVAEEQALKQALEEKGASVVIREQKCFPTGFCMKSCDYGFACKAMLLDDAIEFDKLDEQKFGEIFGA
ncbi:MAG: PD-(D/E)XK nuclease family protein [Cetobacterium sp.]|uniref:PD-(D/E)XK nuclease family protein n=1 Tax=Cetobacterium sp. TaxID=2071632 RepID=UPI003F3B2174